MSMRQVGHLYRGCIKIDLNKKKGVEIERVFKSLGKLWGTEGELGHGTRLGERAILKKSTTLDLSSSRRKSKVLEDRDGWKAGKPLHRGDSLRGAREEGQVIGYS